MVGKKIDSTNSRGNFLNIILQSDSKMQNLFQRYGTRVLFSSLIISFSSILLLDLNFSTETNNEYLNVASNNYNAMLKDVWAENINGTANDDNITGTINQDMIKGLGGNDTLSGQEAGDDISGGDGDDVIFGGDGRDFLRGKSGNDQIDGGGGNDRLYGYNGNDILIGGPGNDVFIGGPGADKFICGTGKDTVSDFNQTEGDVIPDNDCETINKANALDQVAIDSDQGEEQQQEIFNFQNQSLEGGADQTIQDSEDNIMREDNGADNGDPVSNIFKFFK